MSDTAKFVGEILARHKTARNRRSLWHRHWDDLAQVQMVRRLGFATDVQEGERRTNDLFDGTSMQEARSLANKLGGHLRPEGQPWFFMRTADDKDMAADEAKEWLTESQNRMRRALNRPVARFRQATGEFDQDIVVLGTAVMFAGQLVRETAQLIYQTIWLKDAVPTFDTTGVADGMFRTRKMSLRHAAAKWGLQRLSPATQDKIVHGEGTGRLDEMIEFLFAIVPRPGGNPDAFLARNLPVTDDVIEVEAKHLVTRGGFHEFPYIVARWDTTSGEEYGRSPGMIALPDSNTSQAIGETILVAGQKAADPPLLTPSGAFINAPHTYPGALATYEAGAVRDLGPNPIRPLETGRNFPLTRDIQQDTREQIRTAFLRDKFNLPKASDFTNRTATEVVARLEEFIQETGPLFGRMETDYTAPMIERTFKMMLRGGAFEEIPDVMRPGQGGAIVFEYESPVKRIREQAESIASTEWVRERVEMSASTQKPEILDPINWDGWTSFSHKANNIPADLLNSDDVIEELREGRAEQLAQEQEMAQAQQIAATAKDGAAAARDITIQRGEDGKISGARSVPART